MFQRSSICAGAMLLSACMVGPDYRAPRVAVGARWLEPASLSPVDLAWWHSFGDPELDRLVAIALNRNWDLREAEARVAEVRANRDVAAGGALPQVTAKGSVTENQVSKNGQLPVANIPGFDRRYSLYDVGFDASWELDLWGRNRRELEASDARVQSSEWSRRDLQVALIAELARNYIDLRKAQQNQLEARERAASYGELARLSALRFRAGEDTKLAADEARSQAAAGERAIALAEASVSTAAYRIAALVGAAPETIVPALRDGATPIPTPPATIAMGIRSDLLQRRADIRNAERDLAASSADIGIATAELFPRISLLGSLGQQARKPGDLLSSASTRFSIGPSFSWPLLDFGRIRAQIRAAKARDAQAGARYEKAVVNALSDSEAAANRFANTARAAAAAREAEARERSAFDLATLRFKRGEDDRLALERARLKWLQARQAAEEAKADYSAAAIALNKALGGGWST